MSKYCFNCKSTNIKEVTKENKKFYFCDKCKKTESRFYSDEDGLFVTNTESGPKHITVGAIIYDSDGRIFLAKRRVWPFCYSLIVGHLEYGESPKNAIQREVIEESGIILGRKKLIYHGDLSNDPCRYGVDIHEWYLYSATVSNSTYFLNSESESAGWFTKTEALKLNLTEPTRYFLENIDNIKKDNVKKAITLDDPFPRREVGNIFTEEKRDGILFHISQALLKVHDINSVLKIATREVLHAIDAGNSCIYLPDSKNNILLLASHAIKTEDRNLGIAEKISISDGVIGKCAQNRQLVFSYDFKKATRSPSEPITIAIPMISGNDFFGVLSVSSRNKDFFTETEVQFLNILSSQIASAVSNAKLYDELTRKIQSLSKLFGVTAIYSKQTKQSVQKMLNAIPTLLDCESCILRLFRDDYKDFEVFASSGKWHDKLSPHALKITLSDNGLTVNSFLNKQPYYSNSALTDNRVNSRLATVSNSTSLISVPVLVNQKCLGVLNIINQINNNFTEEDVKLASVVATHIGTKIENDHLIEKTKTEKELLDRIIEGISDGVVVLNREGKIILWNRYIEEITHLKAADTLNINYQKIFLEELGLKNISSAINSFCHNIGGTKDTVIEEEMTDKSGARVWLSAAFSCLQSRDHHGENLVIVLRNISKEKNLIQIKNEFITTTAHELRTPLTSITGYLSMILHGDAGELNSKQAKYFTRAYMSTERLTHLVEDLLEALRIEEDRVALNIQSFDINRLIFEVIDNLSSKAKKKSIYINFSNAKSLLAYADQIKTKHIIENIVDNAIKYTGDKGRIDIDTNITNNQIIISVEDSGVGIKKEYLKTIFDRFVRAPNKLSVKAGGTGLGLFIAKKLANKQQGDIWVKSENNKGTTFYIAIPSFIK